MSKRISAMAAALPLACLSAWGGAMADTVTLVQSVPHITTTGVASATVVPDQADIYLGVDNERPTIAEASDATARAAGAVIDALKAQGVDAKDIRTSFTLTAVYDEERDAKGQLLKRSLRGYQANEAVTVRMHDVAKVGPLARTLIDSGANAFRGFAFSYSKERSKRRELEAEATRDALAEARIYTDAIGVKLGRPLQIGNDSQGDGAADLPSRRAPPVFEPADGNVQKAAPVMIPTEPGTQVIVASITVVWEIKGSAP